MADPDDDIQSKAPPPVPKGEAWREFLVEGRRGQVDPQSRANVMVVLEYHNLWKGVFVLDEFADQIIVRRCPPWESDARFRVHRVEHYDIVRTAAALEYKEFFSLNASIQTVENAILAVSKKNKIHPVREYFDALKWDGDERLGTWLFNYLQAREQNPDYLHAVGSQWMTAAARRIYEPGCKYDHMLVLEGAQNIGKSYSLRTMATFGRDEEVEYFTDSIKFENAQHPSSIAMMQGKLIIEVAELAGMNRREIEDVKNWITVQVDEVQKKYENHVTSYRRQFVLAGTTNESTWLRDPTGNRRFLPVKCCGKIDIDRLRRDREQLWAEAVYRHKSGMDIYLPSGSEIEMIAMREQESRLIEDVWEDAILSYLGGINTSGEVTIAEIMRGLTIDAGHMDELKSRRVARVLRQAGWESIVKYERATGKTRRVWTSPEKLKTMKVVEIDFK